MFNRYIWSRAKYLQEFGAVAKTMAATTDKKNGDYSSADDAFVNFRLIEELTGGRITMEDGILVRMTDKLVRAINLSARPAQVADEAMEDTALDLAVYAMILNLARRTRTELDELVTNTLSSAPLGGIQGFQPEKSALERLREFLKGHPEQEAEIKRLAESKGLKV